MRNAPLSGIVLAGGSSRRMGQDKALLLLDGTTLLSHVVKVLARVADEVLIVGRVGLPADVTGAIGILDEDPGNGPLGGLLTGLCQATHEWVVVTAVDLPFMEAGLFRRLAELRGGSQAVVPLMQSRPQPLCALYHRSATEQIRAQLRVGDRRMIPLVSSIRTRWVPGEELREIDPFLRSFTNINSRDEWEQIVTRADQE